MCENLDQHENIGDHPIAREHLRKKQMSNSWENKEKDCYSEQKQ